LGSGYCSAGGVGDGFGEVPEGITIVFPTCSVKGSESPVFAS